MALYTTLISHAFFPIHEWIKKHDSVAILRQLETSQWLSREKIDSIRLQKLRSLLLHAQEVPYYKDLFARVGFNAHDVRSLNDLHRLPLLTKADMRGRQEDFRSSSAGSLKRLNTGGSSGEPLIFFVGKDRVSHDVAAKWRATRWWGVDIGDKEMVVWGSPIELGAQDKARLLRDKLLRSELLPAFNLSESGLSNAVNRIWKRRPTMLFGYPSALTLIAKHAERLGVKLDDIGLRVVFVTSEMLYPDQRSMMQRVYGCPVANGYGGRDAGFIAHECPGGSMHITAEDIIVETVDAAGQPVPMGQAGEIVVTHLASGDFPFIRYRTGDMGVLSDEQCSCRRGLPILSEVHGRATDFIIASDGTMMHGLALIYVVRDLPGIRKFRIVQETLKHIRVQIVEEPGFSDALRSKIIDGISARMGDDVTVTVESVDDILPGRSGKYRYVESRLQPSGALS